MNSPWIGFAAFVLLLGWIGWVWYRDNKKYPEK